MYIYIYIPSFVELSCRQSVRFHLSQFICHHLSKNSHSEAASKICMEVPVEFRNYQKTQPKKKERWNKPKTDLFCVFFRKNEMRNVMSLKANLPFTCIFLHLTFFVCFKVQLFFFSPITVADSVQCIMEQLIKGSPQVFFVVAASCCFGNERKKRGIVGESQFSWCPWTPCQRRTSPSGCFQRWQPARGWRRSGTGTHSSGDSSLPRGW